MAGKSHNERRWLERHKTALNPLRDHTLAMLPLIRERQLASATYGLARSGLAGPKWATLFDALAEASVRSAEEFDPQAISNTAWAFATAKHTAPTLFDALAEASVRIAHDFAPQEISNTAWAFATAKHASPALFDALAAASVRKARAFDPQAISNIAWAFATAKHASPALFDALAAVSVQKAHDFVPQAISNTAWAFATAKHASPTLFDTLASEIGRRGGLASFKDRRAQTQITRAFEDMGVPLPDSEEAAKEKKRTRTVGRRAGVGVRGR